MSSINTAAIVVFAASIGLPLIEPGIQAIIAGQQLVDPTATREQIESTVDGTLKHTVRGKIGFAVDIVWPIIDPYVKEVIDKAFADMAPAPPTVIAQPDTVSG